MDVSLTPELETLVQAKVQSGRYNSVSEVIIEALRLFEQHDDLRAVHLQELRFRMDQGLVSVARGEGVEGEGFMQSLLDDHDSREVKPKVG